VAIPGEDLHLSYRIKQDVTHFALNKIAAVFLSTAVITSSLIVYKQDKAELVSVYVMQVYVGVKVHLHYSVTSALEGVSGQFDVLAASSTINEPLAFII
jgi:hypothetical protein